MFTVIICCWCLPVPWGMTVFLMAQAPEAFPAVPETAGRLLERLAVPSPSVPVGNRVRSCQEFSAWQDHS